MIGWLILAAVVVLAAVLCLRAAQMKPNTEAYAPFTPVQVDAEKAVAHLAAMVRAL